MKVLLCKNFISTYSFVCENNLFSCFTDIKERQPKNLIKNISKTFNIKTSFLNGNI